MKVRMGKSTKVAHLAALAAMDRRHGGGISPMEICSVYADSRREVDVFKWLESEKAGYDLGELAIRRWVQQHWNGYLRARWLEHFFFSSRRRHTRCAGDLRI